MTTDQHKVDAPRTIGHFQVVDILGEGGMGTVYVGLDTALDRRVALKVIRQEHRLDPERKARLLREARILSQLNHPGVCQLHDFIEGEDTDCLVLELVEGGRLRDAMDEGLGRAESLQIVAQILDVLVAVHGRGVVHRDLKPENVMITPDGTVKLLDLGLAREEQASEPAGERPREGDAGAQNEHDGHSNEQPLTSLGTIVGTVGYMSPEQARGEPAMAASDMYSLGLIMQEMLTGRCPISRELPRDIRLRCAMWGESEPVTGLPPDLTALIERLKEFEPAARPAAVDAAAMLQRVLDRPRRRRQQIAVAAVIAVLVAFGTGMTVQYLRAERETRRAEFEAETARQVSEFLRSVFEISNPSESRGSSVTARELLDKAAARIEDELGDRPLVQATMMDTMGFVYQELGLYEQASSLLEGALELRREHLPASHPDLATSLDTLGTLRVAMGQYDLAEPLLEEALTMRRQIFGHLHRDVASSLDNTAHLLAIKGDYAGAEALVREALATRRLLFGEEHQDVAISINNLAFLRWKAADYDEAETLFREALALNRRLYGEDHPEVATCLQNLASMLNLKGEYDGAEEAFREALVVTRRLVGDEHPDIAETLSNLALVLRAKGDLDGAETLMREALAMRRRLLGNDHSEVAQTLNNLGVVLTAQGRLGEAETKLREALAIRRRTLGDEHPDVAESLSVLGVLFRAKGDLNAAEMYLRDALATDRRLLGDTHPAVAANLTNLGLVLLKRGDPDAAETMLKEALKIKEQALGSDHPGTAKVLAGLAEVLQHRGDVAGAESLLRRALAIQRKALPPGHPDIQESLRSLASLLRQAGRASEAEALEAERDAVREGYDGGSAPGPETSRAAPG